MTTLISFLGKGQADRETGYRTASYDFGSRVHTVAYFGLALTHELHPDRLVLVGTAGSMWDVFFEQQGADDEEKLPALIDAVAEARVTDDLLATHQKRLAEKLGLPVQCLLIPYARDTVEQVAVLQQLAGAVRREEKVVLDVTHGFRHLPMLALVAARYLTHVAGVRVEAIYYGAVEMIRDGKTPVLRLDGMLQMLDWVEALATFEKDGDYGVFETLLVQDGMPADKAGQLRRAAYFERTSNPVKAHESIAGAFPAIDAHAGPLAALFRHSLKKRIAWFRGQARHDWELSLADAYLGRRDYLRATIFLYEAFVTRACFDRKLDHNDYSKRENAWKEAKEGNRPARKLEYLRNALTHGIKPDDEEIARWVGNEEQLRQRLEEFRRTLFR